MTWNTWEPVTTAAGEPAARWTGDGSLLAERRKHGVRGRPQVTLLVTAAFVEAAPVFFYTSGHMEVYEDDPPVRAGRDEPAAWAALEALVAPGLLAEARAWRERLTGGAA